MSVTESLTRANALRSVTIFRGLDRATLLDVARKTKEVTHPAGATVVREGDPGDMLCIIARGTVEVQVRGRTVAQMTDGDFFGEISLVDGKPRSATVVTVDDVVLYTLSRSDFEDLLDIPRRSVAYAALRGLAERVREAHAAHES